jgi:UDP-glucose 4-epimerase
MKVVVFGGCGFIGSHMVEKLVEKGHEVRVFDRLNASVENISSVVNKIDLFYGDFSDEAAVKEAVTGFEVIYHLISTTFPGSTIKSGIYDVRSNLIPTINLLETAINKGTKHIIYLSSGGTVYGHSGDIMPIKESFRTEPSALYGLSKLTIENYIKLYCTGNGTKYTIMRVSNVYGPRQNIYGIQGLIAVAIGNLIYKRPQIIWGSNEIYRDYIYIDDLIRAMYRCIESGKTNQIFNVGSGKGYSISSVLETLEKASGRKMTIITKEKRAVDVPYNVLCIDKIKKELAWKPEITLDDGAKITWEWANAKYNDM